MTEETKVVGAPSGTRKVSETRLKVLKYKAELIKAFVTMLVIDAQDAHLDELIDHCKEIFGLDGSKEGE